MSTIAVFLVVGGASALAASQLGKNTVGSKQLKKNSVTTAKIKNGAVTGSKVKLSSLGTVPSATNAAHATSADKATLADKATTAVSSEKLGTASASQYVQKTAQSGEVLTGQLSARYFVNGSFWLAGGSYRSPLAPGTPVPTLVYTTSTTSQCAGIGQAAPGVLCVYGYNVENVDEVNTSGQFGESNYRFGFSVDIFPTTAAATGYLLASWAYQVP